MGTAVQRNDLALAYVFEGGVLMLAARRSGTRHPAQIVDALGTSWAWAFSACAWVPWVALAKLRGERDFIVQN